LATYSSISDSVVFAMAACSILLCLLFTLFLTPESLPKHTQRAKRRQIVHEDALARERAIEDKMAKMMAKQQQRIQEGGGALAVVSSSDADDAASSEGRPSEFSMPPDALPRVSVAYPSLTASSSQQQHDGASNPNNARRRPSAHFTTPLLVCQGGPARPTASSGEMEEFSRSMSSSSSSETGLASASNDHSAAASGKLRPSLTGPGMVSVAPSFASMPVPKSGAVLRVLVFNNPIKPLMILNRTWFLRTLAFVAVLLFFCLMGMSVHKTQAQRTYAAANGQISASQPTELSAASNQIPVSLTMAPCVCLCVLCVWVFVLCSCGSGSARCTCI
jgi:hypothetical protein